MAATSTRPYEFTDADRTIHTADEAGRLLLDALNDPGCRSILDATGEEAMSANELSEACDLPLSTTYRKLELLTEAGLLSEGIRIRRSGKHTNEYTRRVEEVHLTMCGDGGLEMTLEARAE